MNTGIILRFALAFLFTASIVNASGGQGSKESSQGVVLIKNETEKKVEVTVNGKLFTIYRWPDNICKPVLYPVFSPSGTEITRGFPVDPRAGERIDHPHQIGMWLTYGNVNGLDFWGNGSQGLGTKNPNGGFIHHVNIEKTANGKKEGVLITNESWQDGNGKELLKEHSEFHFMARNDFWIIDRITTLTAGESKVEMPDTKEGMFGIRVARQLELPARDAGPVLSTELKPVKPDEKAFSEITGNYLSSEALTGEAVWGKRARWMNLSGNIGKEKLTLSIMDHPSNPNYPTYWHARGYGLFAANPLGVKDFTSGKETLNLSVEKGKSIVFRYRFVVGSNLSSGNNEFNKLADEFAEMYK